MTTNPAQSRLGMTFEEMLVLAAKEGGEASVNLQGRPVLPSDLEARYRAEEAVKTAMRRLVAAFDWSWLDQEYSFSIGSTAKPTQVNGAIDRYRLPWDFGGAWSTIAYRDDALLIDIVDAREIEQYRSVSYDSSGDPNLASIVRAEDGSSAYDIIFWPEPDTDRTLLLRYRAYPNLPQNLSDRFIAPPEFDAALEAAIVLAVHERTNSTRLGTAQETYYRELEAAKERDRRSRSGVIGNMGGGTVSEGYMPPLRTITSNGYTIYV